MNYKYELTTGAKRLKTKLAIAFSALALVGGGTAMSLALFGSAHAVAPVTVYDALPSVSPATNYPSQAFQAQQTKEFGDYIHLGGTARVLNTVTVTMSDWAYYSQYSGDSRYSGNSAYWTHPITVNVYSANTGNPDTVNTLLGTVTQDTSIPWRPAPDSCDATGWTDAHGDCVHGLAFNASFDFSTLHVTLPDNIIVSVAFNTQSYGNYPIGENGPYNSLNVAVPDNQNVSVGNDVNSNAVFWDSITGTGGQFVENSGWSPNGTVAFKVTANGEVSGKPANPGCFGQDRAAWLKANGGRAWGEIARTRAGDNGAINQAYKTSCGGDPSH